MLIVMAGATGALGKMLLQKFKAQGHHLRVIVRSASATESLRALGADEVLAVSMDDSTALRKAMQDCELLWSSVGASTALSMQGWKGYHAVDVPINSRLIDAAKAANVKRFAYTSLAHAQSEGVRDVAYTRAHEQVVQYARESGLRCNVLRPTGFFSALEPIARAVAKGFPFMVFGDGSARTNPIHPQDLADCAVKLVEQDLDELEVGGPEILTRREIVELAFKCAGRPVRIVRIAPVIGRIQAGFVRLFHPRLGQLMRFGLEVSTHDCLAPAHGTLKLEDYFRAIAQRQLQA
jgi:uncharacterized protein YbjT (DUF2867 family)